MLGSCVGDGEARADGQGRQLIDRVAAGAPVRQLLVVKPLGHARVPFAGFRPDHRAGIELAAIDVSKLNPRRLGTRFYKSEVRSDLASAEHAGSAGKALLLARARG